MSGVSGNERVSSRQNFDYIVKEYTKLISGFPGFNGLSPSGSYNSNKSKTTFGDIDLIVHIDGSLYDNDKAVLKKRLAEFLTSKDNDTITPFQSEKYKGKRFYNSGEIITVSYQSPNKDIPAAQVDNVIVLDSDEAEFKTNFLDFPAEKQGLILGLVKVISLEEKIDSIAKRMGISNIEELEENQEYSFNLSSVELQLRKVTYEAGSFKEKTREIVWKNNGWQAVVKLLKSYDLSLSFDDLLATIKKKLKNPRSGKRITGVFKSMISVKSGEVGTEKGQNKTDAIQKVSSVLGEQTQRRSITSMIAERLNDESKTSI
jgi:hypothetical protein